MKQMVGLDQERERRKWTGYQGSQSHSLSHRQSHYRTRRRRRSKLNGKTSQKLNHPRYWAWMKLLSYHLYRSITYSSKWKKFWQSSRLCRSIKSHTSHTMGFTLVYRDVRSSFQEETSNLNPKQTGRGFMYAMRWSLLISLTHTGSGCQNNGWDEVLCN